MDIQTRLEIDLVKYGLTDDDALDTMASLKLRTKMSYMEGTWGVDETEIAYISREQLWNELLLEVKFLFGNKYRTVNKHIDAIGIPIDWRECLHKNRVRKQKWNENKKPYVVLLCTDCNEVLRKL